MTELIMKLSGLFGPSGYEDAVRSEIKTMAEPYADVIDEDGLGNLYVHKKGKVTPEKPVVLAGYMDECGIMTKDTDDDGFTGFGIVGDVQSGTVLGKQVLIGPEMHQGVIGLKPFHLTEPEERKRLPKASDLYIDAGFAKKDEAEKAFLPGELGVFYGTAEKMGRNLWGKALGRSLTCAVLLELVKEDLPVDVTFVFTSQRQVGARGAMAAGHRLKAGTVIVLDLCPGADKGEELPLCGKGAVVPDMDKCAIYHRNLTFGLRNAAKNAGVPCQMAGKTEISGGGGAFLKAGEGARVAALCCPGKYLDSPCQAIRPEDGEAVKMILKTFLEEMDTWN